MTGLLESVHGAIDNVKAHRRNISAEAAAFAEEKMHNVRYVDLTIQFIGAQNLPVMDVGGTADPYFHAKLDGKIHFTSSVVVGSLNPVWNEVWRVMNVPSHACLNVEVMDKDDGALTDDYIGKFETTVSAGAKEAEISGPLLKRTRGTFWMKIDSKPSLFPDPASHAYTFDGPIRYSRHRSPILGRLTNLNDERLYSTWKVTLSRVPLSFHTLQHWNVKYLAAQKIFQNSGSFAVRSGIQAGHRLLYARSTRNAFGPIDHAYDFLDLLRSEMVAPRPQRTPSPGKNVVDRVSPERTARGRIKPAVYTYVIAAEDGTLRFSETGAPFFVDFASKHALHASCAESVVYSGEFHPRPKQGWDHFSDNQTDEETEWVLVFDNNSGTYAPDKTLLPTLEGFLLSNFRLPTPEQLQERHGGRSPYGGFDVEVYDREDERLTRSREACRAYATSKRGVRTEELEPHVGEGEVSLEKQASAKAVSQRTPPADTTRAA